MKKFFLRCLLPLVLAFAAAGADAAVRKQTPRNAVEVSAVEDGGQIRVKLKIEPQNGWQIYSHNPGEVGLPTKVEWRLYDHRLVAEEWSEGEDIIYEGYGLNVYRRPAAYSAVLDKAAGEMPDLEISWMACNGECVPESLAFKLTPEVFAAAPAETVPGLFAVSSLPGKNPAGRSPYAGAEKTQSSDGWLEILLLAFAGGIVLNFMPCVFPILFIKIMSITGEKERRRNVIEAFQYAGGVLSCFALTAALLSWLRHRGAEIGWGFQLQSPYFVAAMALLFLLLALMFLNVIKVNWSLKYLPAGSFMTGLLAVLIASPCTAPFMGAAVGWALPAGLFLLSGISDAGGRLCAAVLSGGYLSRGVEEDFAAAGPLDGSGKKTVCPADACNLRLAAVGVVERGGNGAVRMGALPAGESGGRA